MSTPLSREGLSVLELLPQWQLRPHLRPASSEPWGVECQALIVAVAANDIERRLWANIGKAMQALGLHSFWLHAELLASEQTELALQRVMHERPGVLLVFGDGLKKALVSMQPAIAESCTLRSVESLSLMTGSAKNKHILFSSLVELKRGVS